LVGIYTSKTRCGSNNLASLVHIKFNSTLFAIIGYASSHLISGCPTDLGECSYTRPSLNVGGGALGSDSSSNISLRSQCFNHRSTQFPWYLRQVSKNIWIELHAVWKMYNKVARMPAHCLVIHVLIGIYDPLFYKSDSFSYSGMFED